MTSAPDSGFAAGIRRRRAKGLQFRYLDFLPVAFSLGYMGKLIRWLFILRALILPAGAILPATNSYVLPSADGTRLLVMRPLVAGKPYEYDRSVGPVGLPDGRSVELGATFPVSGVYDVATLRSLWTWDWYVLEGELAVSDDLSSMGVISRYAADQANEVALEFFHEGRPGKTHRTKDLLRAFASEPFLETSTLVGLPLDWIGKFEARGNQLRLSTMPRRYLLGYHEDYRFDLATGNMVASAVRAPWGILLIPGIGLVIVAFRLAKRFKSGRPADQAPAGSS